MADLINIAVDAMGGDNSPRKILEGIKIHSNISPEVEYKLFGNQNKIETIISEISLDTNKISINHTENTVNDNDSPLSGAKKGKDTSLWLAIDSLKKNEADAIVSAGNTGALFVISKLNLNISNLVHCMLHTYVGLKLIFKALKRKYCKKYIPAHPFNFK